MRTRSHARDSNVVRFPETRRTAQCLTQQDKQDVAAFRDRAAAAGYDSLMIHRTADDGGVGTRDYVTAHWGDEAWSSWGFARNKGVICCWNALTSKDAGTFETMFEALERILTGLPGQTALPFGDNAGRPGPSAG